MRNDQIIRMRDVHNHSERLLLHHIGEAVNEFKKAVIEDVRTPIPQLYDRVVKKFVGSQLINREKEWMLHTMCIASWIWHSCWISGFSSAQIVRLSSASFTITTCPNRCNSATFFIATCIHCDDDESIVSDPGLRWTLSNHRFCVLGSIEVSWYDLTMLSSIIERQRVPSVSSSR